MADSVFVTLLGLPGDGVATQISIVVLCGNQRGCLDAYILVPVFKESGDKVHRLYGDRVVSYNKSKRTQHENQTSHTTSVNRELLLRIRMSDLFLAVLYCLTDAFG